MPAAWSHIVLMSLNVCMCSKNNPSKDIFILNSCMPGRRLGQKMLCVTHHTAAETHQHQEELKIHDFILFKWPVNTCSHLETCVLHNDSSLFPEVKALRTSH